MDSFSLEGDLACAVERRDVRVKLCSSHARRIEPTLERSILAEWATRLAAHPRMFNGRKFRFGRVAARESGEKGAAFELGLTDYRSMVGTNMSSRWREIEAKDPTLLANPVGNAAVVETADGCVLLLKRIWGFTNPKPPKPPKKGPPKEHLAATTVCRTGLQP